MNIRKENEQIANQKTEELLCSYPFYMRQFYDDMNGKSHRTKRNYVIYIFHMLNYIRGREWVELKDVVSITTDELSDYMTSLEYRVLKNGNVKTVGAEIKAARWTAISYFFRFLKKKNYIYTDPFTEYIERPMIKEEGEKQYLSKLEIKNLIKHIEQNPEKCYRDRDLAIVTLVFSTGIKESALAELNVSDVDFDNKRILLHGKKENRYIYPANIAMDYIKTWLLDRTILALQKTTNFSQALFVSRTFTRMTPSSLIYMLSTYVDIFDKNVTFETLRSSCIVYLYEESKDAFMTIKVAGLKSLRELERYIKVEKDCEKYAGDIMENFLYNTMELEDMSTDEEFELLDSEAFELLEDGELEQYDLLDE